MPDPQIGDEHATGHSYTAISTQRGKRLPPELERVRAGARRELPHLHPSVLVVVVPSRATARAAYLLRDGRLRRLTRDHSVAQILLDAREITAAQATSHPGRAQLTRHVGMDGEVLPDASCHGIRHGDRLLLCTDGLTGPLRDAHMERILEQHPDPASASRALVDAAQQAGGGDDVTALVLAN